MPAFGLAYLKEFISMNNTEAWEQINRMQRICMDKESYITKHEFFSEPMEERRAFYNWMRNQVNQYQAASYWAGDDKNPIMLSGGYTV